MCVRIVWYFLFAAFLSYGQSTKENIVCYFVSENGFSRAPPEVLDPHLCTHVIYAFADVDQNGTLRYRNEQLDIKNQMYRRFVSMKERNPKLKVLISVFSAHTPLSVVAANENKRLKFAKSTRKFLEEYSFDGVDIDWEKPNEADRDNFVSMMKALSEEFRGTKLISSIAVFPRHAVAYDAEGLSKYADMLNVMAYNFYGPWSKRTGQHSGLYASSKDSLYEKRLNTNSSIQSWISAGASRGKLMMGIPFYGRCFTLKDSNKHDVHAPITGSGKLSVPTYSQIHLQFDNWTMVWDDEQKNYYRYQDNEWVGYEEERSVREKVSYATREGLGGIMIWHIGADDVRGEFGPKQGLLAVINHALGKHQSVAYS